MPLAVSWVSLQDVGVSAGLNYPLAVELLGGNDGVFLPHPCFVLAQS